MKDQQQTLEQLERKNWGEPETAPTPMVARCLRLRRVPLHALGRSDLRLLISQKIGLDHTVPAALKFVSEDALLQAEYYPGDLLSALLSVDADYWSRNPAEFRCLRSISQSVVRQYGKIVGHCESFLARELRPSRKDPARRMEGAQRYLLRANGSRKCAPPTSARGLAER